MSFSDHIAWTTLLWTIVCAVVGVAGLVTLWAQLLWPLIKQWRASGKAELSSIPLAKPNERPAPCVSVCRTYFDLDYAYNQLYPEGRSSVVVRQQDGNLFLDHASNHEVRGRNRLL